jgi:hypothetical protein
MIRGRALAILLLALLTAPHIAARQLIPPTPMTATEGVALVRQVNQIMGRLMLRTNKYMTLRDVAMDPTFTRLEPLELINADSGIYKRYKLTVTGVEGLDNYQVSLVPANGCGPSWFSNETGLIFAGNCLQ